jgi:hypothetical protein
MPQFGPLLFAEHVGVVDRLLELGDHAGAARRSVGLVSANPTGN